ncbi:cyclophilin [Laetiporus sulphureus 93-53]|uniref:Peptidyl-prolyl cis-trans isomerase n=1 Tax=Laetiporus sulphureus 93-53 TaxID=1314785 RepID=A0A165DEM4_9APHY|nr:cyclophilin [Laetiporus sulphureus 93-53]KZT04716.1 cyclophilin [Laetiporus sulphureus 93-53]
MSNRNIFFDINVNGMFLECIVFKLYDNVVSKMVKNFYQLAIGQRGSGYKGCSFHRIIPHFLLQDGDITCDDSRKPIYGKKFADENLTLKHEKAGLLSMVKVRAQFFITMVKTEWLNGSYVVFGEVLDSYDNVVKKIELLGCAAGTFTVEIIIANSSVV